MALGLPDSGVAAGEGALDGEDRVDPPDRFCSDRRDDGRATAPSLELAGEVGKLEKLAPCMRPAERTGQRHAGSPRIEQRVVAGIGIGLEEDRKSTRLKSSH